MSRTMFPFDDYYRVAFNGTLLPSQNQSGEIVPLEIPDERFEKVKLDDAPAIPFWRKKEATVTSKSPLKETTSETTENEQAPETSTQKDSPDSPTKPDSVEPQSSEESFETANNNNDDDIHNIPTAKIEDQSKA